VPNDRIVVIEPYGNGSSNRELRHGQSGEDALRDLKIHHPNTNRAAVAAGDPRQVDRAAGFVEGELEAIRTRGDRNGVPLVSKDLIFENDSNSRNLMIPNPVAGYAQFRNDGTNAISIWSGPPSDPRRELVGQVLHGARGSSPFKDGDFVPYGVPLVRQSDVGSRGAVHAHIELEPDQYRRYLGDILNDRITLSRWPEQEQVHQDGGAQSRPEQAQTQDPSGQQTGVLKIGSQSAAVHDLQTSLAALGYTGMDGKLLTPDSDFGANTDHAVRAFQQAHGLQPIDGKVGADTRAALAQAAQRPLVSEASHPNHALYAQLARQLPAGTDPRITASITLQAMENGITSPDKLERMAVQGNDVFLLGTTPGDRLKADLQAPVPELQASSDHMAAQSAQARQREQADQRSRQQEPQALAL
jgi:hypothetical protein